MSFLVVKTIEDEKIFLITVPVSWCDEKTLFFPNSGNWKTFRRNKIPPELDWRRYRCEVKGKYNEVEDALQAEKRFANFEDTEDEERYFTNLKEKRTHPARVLTARIENNYNERSRELSSSLATTSTTSGFENSSGSEMDTFENDIADETLIENSEHDDHFQNVSEDGVLLVNLPNMATSIEELKGDTIKLNAKADKILDILV
ncbi:hypothetical protein JTB14_025959 [Gonioctena quinquepunctata]|nr:hypothetical protein JTB14_025959 [Gonioctena quinquepunctata]